MDLDFDVGFVNWAGLHEIRVKDDNRQTQLLKLEQLNTPTGASTNPKNFDLTMNLNRNLI